MKKVWGDKTNVFAVNRIALYTLLKCRRLKHRACNNDINLLLQQLSRDRRLFYVARNKYTKYFSHRGIINGIHNIISTLTPERHCNTVIF